MELFKQEMELFLPLPVLWSKNFFNKNFLISTQEFKIDFQNRNRNYLNRKRNYLSHFRASDQKTSFTRCSHFSQGVWDWYSKQEIELFLPLSGWWSNNYFYKKILISTKMFKIGFQNRKRNYLNRKWNYLSHLWPSDEKTSYTRCCHTRLHLGFSAKLRIW